MRGNAHGSSGTAEYIILQVHRDRCGDARQTGPSPFHPCLLERHWYHMNQLIKLSIFLSYTHCKIRIVHDCMLQDERDSEASRASCNEKLCTLWVGSPQPSHKVTPITPKYIPQRCSVVTSGSASTIYQVELVYTCSQGKYSERSLVYFHREF